MYFLLLLSLQSWLIIFVNLWIGRFVSRNNSVYIRSLSAMVKWISLLLNYLVAVFLKVSFLLLIFFNIELNWDFTKNLFFSIPFLTHIAVLVVHGLKWLSFWKFFPRGKWCHHLDKRMMMVMICKKKYVCKVSHFILLFSPDIWFFV